MNLELKKYKNYKELCQTMDWEVKGGNTKKAQLKDLERYCKYHKEGNSFVIDEIYDTPKPKEDNRNKYGDYLEKLIIHEISKRPLNKDKRTITLARNVFYLQLHLINMNYNYCRNNINKFSRYIKVPISCVFDFFNNTGGKLRDNVERTLNKLQNRCLIKWEYRICVKLKSGTTRLATDTEINTILEAERKALKKINEESKKDIFNKGKWNEYQDEISKELKDTKILYSFKVFHINTTKDFREMLLEEVDLEECQSEINATMYLSTLETAKKKHYKTQEKWKLHSLKKGTYFGKPKFQSEQAQLRPQYIEDTKKIAQKIIEFDTYKIDLSEVINEKYTLMEALYDASNDNGDDWGIFLEDTLEKMFG